MTGIDAETWLKEYHAETRRLARDGVILLAIQLVATIGLGWLIAQLLDGSVLVITAVLIGLRLLFVLLGEFESFVYWRLYERDRMTARIHAFLRRVALPKGSRGMTFEGHLQDLRAPALRTQPSAVYATSMLASLDEAYRNGFMIRLRTDYAYRTAYAQYLAESAPERSLAAVE
jgi:hypothetical protein